jgi:hypothetical protein
MTDREIPFEKPTARGYAEKEINDINDQYGWEGLRAYATETSIFTGRLARCAIAHMTDASF